MAEQLTASEERDFFQDPNPELVAKYDRIECLRAAAQVHQGTGMGAAAVIADAARFYKFIVD